MQTNAQAALLAAAQVHTKAAAGTGSGGHSYSDGKTISYKSSDQEVLNTANAFLTWLDEQDVL